MTSKTEIYILDFTVEGPQGVACGGRGTFADFSMISKRVVECEKERCNVKQFHFT